MMNTLVRIRDRINRTRNEDVPLLPLTVESFQPVVTILKAVGYRSVQLGMSLALLEHIDVGHCTSERCRDSWRRLLDQQSVDLGRQSARGRLI